MYTRDELLHHLAVEVTRIQRRATRPLTEEELFKHLLHSSLSEEVDYLLDTLREAQHALDHPEAYDAAAWYERPTVLECDVVRFQNNKDKWIAFIGLLDGKPYEIFTGLADDEEGLLIPKSVTKGKIIRVVQEDGTKRYDFQFTNTRGFKIILEGLSYKFDKEYWNYAKLISGVLRYGMPIDQVIKMISGLQMDSESINSWKVGVERALKKYLPADEQTPDELCTNE